MTWSRTLRTLLVPALAWHGLCSPAAADDPASVTTDTALYCLSLADRVEAAGEMPPPARALWLEGRAMCQNGKVRAGLARMRRAMMIIHSGDNH